jgi:hypothetical protein
MAIHPSRPARGVYKLHRPSSPAGPHPKRQACEPPPPPPRKNAISSHVPPLHFHREYPVLSKIGGIPQPDAIWPGSS